MIFINNEHDKHVFIQIDDEVYCVEITTCNGDIGIDYVFNYEKTDMLIGDDVLELLSETIEENRGDIIV